MPMIVQGDGAGGGNLPALPDPPLPSSSRLFLVRRAAGVSNLKDVPRPDAFSVITTRKASHPKGRSEAEQRALARLTA